MYINTVGGWHPSTSLSWFIQGTPVVPEKLHSPPKRHSTTGLLALMSFDLECIQLRPLERNHQCWLGTYMTNLWKDIYRGIILKPINKSIISPKNTSSQNKNRELPRAFQKFREWIQSASWYLDLPCAHKRMVKHEVEISTILYHL